MYRLSLLALLVASAPAAQTTIPLDRALDFARTQTTAVRLADADILSAQAAVGAADDRRWPGLSLRAGGGQRYGLSFDQTSGGLTQSTVESIDVGLDASYTVYDGGERAADARAAQAGLTAARLGSERSAQSATVVVVEGYLAAARARAARSAAADAHGAERDLLDVVQVQVELGERPASEVAQQQERVAAAQGAVLAAERDLALAQARLVRVLGLDPATAYDFPTPDAPETGPRAPTQDLVRQSLVARADLRAAEADVQAAQATQRAARAGRRPTVSVGAYLGTGFSSAADAGLPGQISDNRAGGLRLNVSLPVFDRGVSGAAVARAAARTAALEAAAEDARRQAALDVQERVVALDALDAQTEVAAVRVAAARTALDAERARYQAGSATLQDVSFLQARLSEALAQQASLDVEANFAPVLLDLAVGL